MTQTTQSRPALLGGPKAVTHDDSDVFAWPIVNDEIEAAVLDCLRRGKMSHTDITRQFEQAYAEWIGVKYALGHNTGTAALQCAMYGAGVGVGDEVISPSLTYWATCLQAFSLGATVVFADVDPDTLTIDPAEIERRITDRTKAIMVVHYAGMPADMDAIMAVADKHDVKVIEDVSHAHGGLYKGRMVGTIGHVAGWSLMSGKSFAIGEGGILTTDDQRIYERAVLFGHYARHGKIELPDLRQYAGLPAGGYKYRMHQLSSAVGLVQVKKYPAEMAAIDKAMNLFCDLVEDVPGVYPYRPAKGSNCTKGGWYFPLARYDADELGGLSIGRFAEAVQAEGSRCGVGSNSPLHLHPVFRTQDVYGHGKPTRVAHAADPKRLDQGPGSLPVTESIYGRCVVIPQFKRFNQDAIEQHAAAWRKVAGNCGDLLADDPKKPVEPQWSSFHR